MGNVRDIRSVARPIEFGNRKEKLEKKRNEILEKHEALKRSVNQLLRGK